MSKEKTLPFAAGTSQATFSGVWRVVVDKNDVFLGVSKASMSVLKISLHQSGVWVLAATKESKATFENGNRRAKRWSRPRNHVSGVTRGPSVLVPHTSLGSRPLPPGENNSKVIWFPAPRNHETVEFSLYFVEAGVPTNWAGGETELAQCHTANGTKVCLLASRWASPADFEETCEKMLRENVFKTQDPKGYLGGSLLWVTESRDALKVPLIVDLPVAIGMNKPASI